MLSNETATGKYPVESVQMMTQIAQIVEKGFPYEIWRNKRQEPSTQRVPTAKAISAASCEVAEQIRARAIIATTTTGYSARQIASNRPRMPIMAATPSERTQRQLALVWGVECLLVPEFYDTDGMLDVTVSALQPYNLSPGDKIVITAGVPFGRMATTNLIQVHRIMANGELGLDVIDE
jgi:pyruvate kinase